MRHLREIDGDNKECSDGSCQIKLDEQIVSREDLEKAKEDPGKRIIEKAPGEYKTLQHLRG